MWQKARILPGRAGPREFWVKGPPHLEKNLYGTDPIGGRYHAYGDMRSYETNVKSPYSEHLLLVNAEDIELLAEFTEAPPIEKWRKEWSSIPSRPS